MPELPEVETIRRGLQRAVVGKTIARVLVRQSKAVSLGPATVGNVRSKSRVRAKKFAALLRGQKIVKIARRAKLLLLDLSGPHTLLAHLKMTGQFIFARKGERKMMKIFNVVGSRRLRLPHQYTRAIFYFTDGSRLYFNDLRQFGYLRLVPDERLGEVREFMEYGPEPLSRDFTFAYWRQKIGQRPNLPVKQFLLDPKIAAGVGNIYSDEILYCAGLRPTRRMRSLNLSEQRALHRAVPKILSEGLRRRGSSVGDYFQVDGSEGTYGHMHRVYGRGGQKCRRCGQVIKKVKLGGRTSSFCPKCQK